MWWDVTTVKYVYAEQGDWAYRSSFWGSVFPGSSIDIYQWIESDQAPAEYEGTGVVYNPSLYTTNTYYNGQVMKTKYYYWVRNIRDIGPGHTLSSYNVANVLVDPKNYGISYAAFTSESDIVVYNLNKDIVSDKTILVVDYAVKDNSQLLHTEWAIMRENYADEVIPDDIIAKTIDSLVGADTVGNPVPDMNLRLTNRYGTMYRPRQSMFKDRFKINLSFSNSCHISICVSIFYVKRFESSRVFSEILNRVNPCNRCPK